MEGWQGNIEFGEVPPATRTKLAKKTDEAGEKVRKADRKASKKTKKTIKP
jgi:hypothetical protein